MKYRFEIGSQSDVGNKRTSNEDSYAAGPEIAVVADGMGGHSGGEIASALATRTLIDGMLAVGLGKANLRLFQQLVSVANDKIIDLSRSAPSLHGMGTTIVGLAFADIDGEMHVGMVNVGDSRIYCLSNGELAQQSVDHSLVEALVQQNRISREEARNHPQRNIVTKALGSATEVQADVFAKPAQHGDRYLLCSDGLNDEITDGKIASILQENKSVQIAANKLVQAAKSAGGRDNITVVVADVIDTSQQQTGQIASANSIEFGGSLKDQTNNADTVPVPIVRVPAGLDTPQPAQPNQDTSSNTASNTISAPNRLDVPQPKLAFSSDATSELPEGWFDDSDR